MKGRFRKHGRCHAVSRKSKQQRRIWNSRERNDAKREMRDEVRR